MSSPDAGAIRTGQPAALPFKTIQLLETTEGREADLIAPLDLGGSLAVVSDQNTYEAMGRRVAKALAKQRSVIDIVLPPGLHCDEETIAEVGRLTRRGRRDRRRLRRAR
jgi:glycerol-1-phosphate dehydrogenase [NAD(P)+]